MSSKCPLCQSGVKLRKSDDNKPSMVYCESYKLEKEGDNFVNKGTCDFHLNFKNKRFGELTTEQMKSLIGGQKIANKKGDALELDLSNKEYFTKFTKVEDEAF